MSASATPSYAGVILLWIRPDGRLLNVSQAACRWLGYSPQELKAMNIWDIDPEFPRDRWPEHWRKLRTLGTLNFTGHHRHRHGAVSEVEVFAHHFVLEGVECVSAVAYPLSPEQRAERALRESEARLALALEVSGQALYELDLITDKLLQSEALARLLGREPHALEVDFETWTDWVHPQDREAILALYQECVSGRRSEYKDVDFRLISSSGACKWLRSVGRVVERDETGRPVRLLGTHLDITEQKEADLALREQTRLLEDLDRASRILARREPGVDVLEELAGEILEIFGADRVFFSTPCDPEASAATIVMEASREGHPGAFASGSEVPMSEELRELLRCVLERDTPVIREFHAASIAARDHGICSQMAMALHPKSGRPWLLGVHQCTHQRQWTAAEQRLFKGIAERVEEALNGQLLLARLKDSEARYRAVFDNSLDAIIVHDPQGGILGANQTMLEMYGLDHAEALQCSIHDLSALENRGAAVEALCERALAGEKIRFEWTAKQPKAERLFPAEVTLKAIGFDGQQAILANVRDISERKHAEEALRESEERFASAFRQSPAPTTISDLKTARFIDANDRWLSMTGFSRDEVIGRTTTEFGHVADRSILGPALEEIAKHGAVRDYPVSVIRKNGETRDYLWSAQKIELRGQEVLLASIQDVTERRRAEEALRQSEERFAKAFESSPVAMLISTIAEGRIIDVNERWLKTLGFRREDMIGRTTKQIDLWDDPSDRDRMIAQLRDIGPFQDVPVVIHAANGERLEILWSTEIITSGESSLLLSSVYDLTPQKRAERALQESEARLRTAVESIPFDLYMLDTERRFVLQNTVSKTRLGDLTGHHASQLPVHQDLLVHFEGMLDRALAGTLVAEETQVGRGQEARHFDNVIAPVKDAGGVRGVIGLTMEITERRQAEAELRQYREHLEELVQERTEALQHAMHQLVQSEKLAALGSLVAGVAHELNTPLGNARMVSSTLGEQIQALADSLNAGALRRSELTSFLESSREAIDLLERNTIRAADLIGHFKKVAVDQTSVRRRRFNLLETMNEVLATLRPTLKRTPHQVELDIPADLELDSYPGPLEQVIANFIDNSLTHGFVGIESGRIRIEARASDANTVQVIYRDNGVGIPSEEQTRIFDPFFTTRLGQGGSGLGLYIVYTLVTGLLGGSVSVSSRVGEGSAFSMRFPREACSASSSMPGTRATANCHPRTRPGD